MKKTAILLMSTFVVSTFANSPFTQRIVNNSVCTLTHVSSFASADVTKNESSSVINPHSSGRVYVEFSPKSVLGHTYSVECAGVDEIGDIELSVDIGKRQINVVTHSTQVNVTAPSKISELGRDITIYSK